MRAILLFALLSTATACGQTGSLYLPDETIESPVEIRKKDDDKKPAEPPAR